MSVPGNCQGDGICEILEQSSDKLATRDTSQINVNMSMAGKEGSSLKFEASLEYPLKP